MIFSLYWPNETKLFIWDQLLVLHRIFSELGHQFVVSKDFNPNANNIIIDGLNFDQVVPLDARLKKNKMKLTLVATEFLELQKGSYRVNNYNMNEKKNQYWKDRIETIRFLSPHIDTVITFAGNPKTDPYVTLLNNESLGFDLGLPRKQYQIANISNISNKRYDFHFSGMLTPYRIDILERLKISGYKILISSASNDYRNRIKESLQAKAGLNIPQNIEWKWVSSMRVYHYANINMYTFHYGSSLTASANFALSFDDGASPHSYKSAKYRNIYGAENFKKWTSNANNFLAEIQKREA